MSACYLKVYKSPVGNARKSLDRSLSVDTLLGDIKHERSLAAAQELVAYRSLYFWDLGVNAAQIVGVGDLVQIVTAKVLYSGRIVAQLTDDAGGIGEAIGWAPQFKKPWTNPVAFERIDSAILDSSIRMAVDDAIATGRRVARNLYEIVRPVDASVGWDRTATDVKRVLLRFQYRSHRLLRSNGD